MMAVWGRQRWGLTGIAVAVIVAAGCGEPAAKPHSVETSSAVRAVPRLDQRLAETPLEPARPPRLTDGTWVLAGGRAAGTLVFEPGGRLSGSDACNDLAGRWRTGPRRALTLSAISTTAAGCRRRPWSNGVDLMRVRRWNVTGSNTLVLVDAAGREVARYRHVPLPTWSTVPDATARRELTGRRCELQTATTGDSPAYGGVVDSSPDSSWTLGGVSDDDRCLAVQLRVDDCQSAGPSQVQESRAAVTIGVTVTTWRDLGDERPCNRPPRSRWVGIPLARPLGDRVVRDGG
jgi:META domain